MRAITQQSWQSLFLVSCISIGLLFLSSCDRITGSGSGSSESDSGSNGGSESSGQLFSGGSGAKSDPYQIANIGDLKRLTEFESSTRDSLEMMMRAHYVLTDDINAANTAQWYEGYGFRPIGELFSDKQDYPFTGTFDGQNHSINGLTMNYQDSRNGEQAVGMFATTDSSARISNLTLNNISIEVSLAGSGRVQDIKYIGGLIGLHMNGDVENVTVNGSITVDSVFATGGLVGSNRATMRNAHSEVDVSTEMENTGGLAGISRGESIIENSSSSGEVEADKIAGGLVGEIRSNSTIRNSSSSATVKGTDNIGGLVGQNIGSTIENSYATGRVSAENIIAGGLAGTNAGNITGSNSESEVSGNNSIGGLVGWQDAGTVDNSYATGNISGNQQIGGLVGFMQEGNIVDSYAEGDVSGRKTVGGLVGGANGVISGSEASGEVSAVNVAGGLAGDVDSLIENSTATGPVAVDEKRAGGLVGIMRSGSRIVSSSANGNVSGSEILGGLVGSCYDAEIVQSYATGNAEGQYHIGGLAGYTYGSTVLRQSYAEGNAIARSSNCGGLVGSNQSQIISCYAAGDVESGFKVGGIVGFNVDNGTVERSFAYGSVTATVRGAGGLAGQVDSKSMITSSYWDTVATSQSSGLGNMGASEQIEGLSTAEMTGESVTNIMSKLDFNEVWTVTDNYPQLVWENE